MKIKTGIHFQNLGNIKVMMQTQASKPELLTQEKQAAARQTPTRREKNPVATAWSNNRKLAQSSCEIAILGQGEKPAKQRPATALSWGWTTAPEVPSA